MIIEILGVVMENLENAILDVGKNAFQKKKLEKDFLESAAFIAALEKPRAISTQSENKREILQMYTRGSELIYNDEESPCPELFDFTYELVWRYEMSFMRYSERMQRRIQEIWDLTSVAEAILVLLLADIEKTWMNKICDSLLELCFYRKEPGLHDFLRLLDISMYLDKMELSEFRQKRISTILADIDSQTDYTQITDESETQIKEIIMTRMLCAHLAYQLYLYEEKQSMEHSDGTLLWKDICRGERSCKEFAEVRNGWT